MNNIAIAIHGGAGTILRSALTIEKEQDYKTALEGAIEEGYKVLAAGKSAVEAVKAAVVCLENNPLFNAGKGSVFNHKGKHEMDAAIMCGQTLGAGAVAGVNHIKNPILLANKIRRYSEHVLLTGEGAEEFAREHDLLFESDTYFFDPFRYQQWVAAQHDNSVTLDHTEDRKFGTVGAVACDTNGNLAAATSTGGMTNKKFNRIGDSPIIGAGTYANNATCAVSCTGHGEYFMRAVVAYDVSCLMEYKGLSLQQACEVVVQDKLVKIGGEGGLIAVDSYGNIELAFNSEGMYRAAKKGPEAAFIAIYKD
ncbi:isoaspartyl peptidase/L-asparaginase family protein [Adhaeribacter aquaticus]|uniref:isoaspartyl peptidase/L-asparaginase family protein n=1 Tax=Adhaeribacter aquaticus TaxID=299567 RepID=UPI0004075A6E|nr:isoaspartyl peptidase/L-asparaginase [Adhaeribacter aquaticus]